MNKTKKIIKFSKAGFSQWLKAVTNGRAGGICGANVKQ